MMPLIEDQDNYNTDGDFLPVALEHIALKETLPTVASPSDL